MTQDGEKTEQPSEKRLRDARRRGEVAKSHDLTSALLMLGALLVFWVAGARAAVGLAALMGKSLQTAPGFAGEMNEEAALAALGAGLSAAAWALAPLLASLFILTLLFSFLQTGPVFSFDAIKAKAENLNPAGNFKKKLLKGRPYIELARTLLKITVTTLIVARALWDARLQLLKLTGANASELAAFVVSFCLVTGLQVGFVFLLFGAGDFLLQRFLFLREQRMTKQEVKQELKESEGDPLIKGARRHLHMEIATQNMLAAVRRADVVVVNPTHVAVALRYETAEMSAPTVVAKGAELIAAEIRRVAGEASVPVIRDVPLARTLYDLDLDTEIPEELYGAVAAVLQFVYKLAQERGEV